MILFTARYSFTIKLALIAFVGLCLYVEKTAFAQDTSIDTISFSLDDWDPKYAEILERGPQFLSAELDTNIVAPEKNSSPATQNEIQYLIALKNKRTKKVTELIKYENSDVSATDMFENKNFINSDDHPLTYELLSLVQQDSEYFIIKDKYKFQRARPSQLSNDIKPIIDVPSHASYPSGHAAQVYLSALVLSSLNPSMETEYKEFAKQVAERREIAGVHYPSDSKAGYLLAEHIFDALMKVEEIRQYAEKAKLEYKI